MTSLLILIHVQVPILAPVRQIAATPPTTTLTENENEDDWGGNGRTSFDLQERLSASAKNCSPNCRDTNRLFDRLNAQMRMIFLVPKD